MTHYSSFLRYTEILGGTFTPNMCSGLRMVTSGLTHWTSMPGSPDTPQGYKPLLQEASVDLLGHTLTVSHKWQLWPEWILCISCSAMCRATLIASACIYGLFRPYSIVMPAVVR